MAKGRVDEPITHIAYVVDHNLVVGRREEYVARDGNHQRLGLYPLQGPLGTLATASNVVRVYRFGQSPVATGVKPAAQLLALVLLVGGGTIAAQLLAVGVGLCGVVGLGTSVAQQGNTTRCGHTCRASIGGIGTERLVGCDSHTLRLVEGNGPRRRACAGGYERNPVGKRGLHNGPLHNLKTTYRATNQ